MEPTQAVNGTPPDDDLGRATVRDLIVQLAQAEDEHRNTASPERIAELSRREQAIVAALHRNGLPLKGAGGPKASGPSTAVCSAEDMLAK
jgi:hypothetical protein